MPVHDNAPANAALGANKSADGLLAIQWFREGKTDQLIAYCRDDVAITKQLFEFGRDNGYAVYPDRNLRKEKLNVGWK